MDGAQEGQLSAHEFNITHNRRGLVFKCLTSLTSAQPTASEKHMKILVTGGAGFIGSHVVEAYLG